MPSSSPRKSTTKSPAKPAVSRELTLAKSANAIITNDFTNMRVGAPVSATQILDVLTALQRKQRPQPKTVKSLRDYASGKISVTALDAKTAEFLATVSKSANANAVKLNRVPKSWPRKNAAILSAIYAEKKPRSPRKPKTETVVPTPVETATTA